MISPSNRIALATLVAVSIVSPAAALEFRESHFAPDACYVRLDRPNDEQAPNPTRQMVTFSLQEDRAATEALSANEMALTVAMSGRSGREARRFAAVCEEGAGSFECVIAQDRGRFTLMPQGDNINVVINEVNLPGNDSERKGLARLMTERGEDRGFVLAMVDVDLCL